MDVVWGETAGVKGQLWILLPILFVLQVIYYLFPNQFYFNNVEI